MCPMSVARRLLTLAALLSIAGTAAAQMNRPRQHQDRAVQGAPIEDLVKQLASPDPAKRLQAVKGLGGSKDPKAIEHLVKALGDSDVRVQAKAVQMLGDMRATEATQVLLQYLLLRTTEPNMKQLIIVSLGKIGDPSAARPLTELLRQDLDVDTRGTVIFALGEIGAPESVETLDHIAQTDQDQTLRRVASEAKSKIQGHHETFSRGTDTRK